MALNQDELGHLVGVLDETGVPSLVEFSRRFSAAARRAKEIIEGRQSPLIILYRVNAGYLPPDHWTQTEEGGGQAVGEAWHFCDLFQYLVGAAVAEVNSTAIGPKVEHTLASGNMSVTLRSEDGSVVTLLYAAMGSSGFQKRHLEICAEGKVLVCDDNRALRVYGTAAKGWTAQEQDKGYFDELRIFATHIRKSDAAADTADLAY